MTAAATATLPLPQLLDTDRYVACQWDILSSLEQRQYWVALYRQNFPKHLALAQAEAAQRGEPPEVTCQRCEAAREHLFDFLKLIEAGRTDIGRVDILRISTERERALRKAGIADPFRLAKEMENATALSMLPQVLADIDALPRDEQAAAVVRGGLAGNLFDLNAAMAADLFHAGKLDFRTTLAQLKPRPWRVDHLDAWVQRLHQGPAYRQAVVFVDNSGSDVLLGMIPLTRDLLRRGTKVILTANASPSLNDITFSELQQVMVQVAALDDTLARALQTGDLRLMSSGNIAPLIDLTKLDPELVHACADVDLVILEGMGRAIESNWEARFACDNIRMAMIKDGGVAWMCGWELYDLVFRFERGA